MAGEREAPLQRSLAEWTLIRKRESEPSLASLESRCALFDERPDPLA